MPSEGGWGDPQPVILADGTHVDVHRRAPPAPAPFTEPHEPPHASTVLIVAIMTGTTVLGLMLAVAIAIGRLP